MLLPRGRAATGTIQDVQHVVILMQENRSFDHYFGSLRGVRGFNDHSTLLFQNGLNAFYQPQGTNYVLPFHITAQCLNDVEHDWGGEHAVWNLGWWNQWVAVNGPSAMTYYNRSDLPFYYALADAYTICDANYCSVMGPTFPNRIYLFTGMIDPNGTGGGPAVNNNVPTNGYSWTTYPERLQAAGITWKVYRRTDDWFGDALPWFAQYMNAAPGNPLYDRGVATVTNVVFAFQQDVTNGTLPQVSWIIPSLDLSEHPSYSPASGENFVKQCLDALASNPAVFGSTVFIITYDENGGFFHHIPPPVPPPGTTNEFVAGQPIGLGVRVPMFIISPWTRGGRVCSQVFDHTSIIRFLEVWTGVPEPNISAWRRQVCGDLTSALDFTHLDTSYPALPDVAPVSTNAVSPPVPSPQTTPVQEPGTRLSLPLPYQPNANASTDCNADQLNITLTNAGSVFVHFAIYANANRTDGPWQFDVAPYSRVNDSLAVANNNGFPYDFSVYGPNGFLRRFAGSLGLDCNKLEVTSSIDTNAGTITLTLQNSTAASVNFTITDGYGLSGPWTNKVSPGGLGTNVFFALANNGGWYDLAVTADGDPQFLRQLGGHIETGSVTPTATNSPNVTIWTIIPPVTNAPPVIHLPPFTLPVTINPVPPTNVLQVFGVSYGTNFMVIYPNWASNCAIDFRTNISQGSWVPVSAPSNILGNYMVVPVPLKSSAGYFRLRH
ncbi:MAG: phosphocholine-specific phospholipase C [Limisphaerales bacterium]